MHLRRALLLFAIVLGLAAIVTTVSQPPRRESPDKPAPDEPGTPTARAPADVSVHAIRFSTTGKPRRVRLGADRPAVVTVRSKQPGQVDIRRLGLTDTAERDTPATFDVLSPRPGRYDVEFTPAGVPGAERVGSIVVPAPTSQQ